jgi:hypothetical protein
MSDKKYFSMQNNTTFDAVIFGSSGLTGSFLLSELEKSPEYATILSIGRNKGDHAIEKVTQLSLDEIDLNKKYPDIHIDKCFICLGTTIKKAGSKEKFEYVDFTLVVRAAAFAHMHGAKKLYVISAIGADEKSPWFYSKVKGKAETALCEIPFEEIHIFRPSLLLGNRNEKRTGESLAIKIYQMAEPFLAGLLNTYRPIPAWQLAKGMLKCSVLPPSKKSPVIYHYKEIKHLLNS